MDNRYRSSGGQQDQRDRNRSYGRQDEQFSSNSDDQYGDSSWRSQENDRWQSGSDNDRGYGRNDSQSGGGGSWSRSSGGSYGDDNSSSGNYDRVGGGSSSGQRGQQQNYGSFSGGYGDYSQSRNTSGYGSDRYSSSSFGSGSYRSEGRDQNRQGGSIPPRQYDRDDRGFFDRASDEVMSWFGDDDASRRRQMDAREDHRGKGPSGYSRSKERVLEDANERLMHDSSVDASNITVTCEDDEITLTGTVDSRHAKRRAEDIVENISGVKHVQNNLRVQQTGSDSSTGTGTNYYSGTSTLSDS